MANTVLIHMISDTLLPSFLLILCQKLKWSKVSQNLIKLSNFEAGICYFVKLLGMGPLCPFQMAIKLR